MVARVAGWAYRPTRAYWMALAMMWTGRSTSPLLRHAHYGPGWRLMSIMPIPPDSNLRHLLALLPIRPSHDLLLLRMMLAARLLTPLWRRLLMLCVGRSTISLRWYLLLRGWLLLLLSMHHMLAMVLWRSSDRVALLLGLGNVWLAATGRPTLASLAALLWVMVGGTWGLRHLNLLLLLLHDDLLLLLLLSLLLSDLRGLRLSLRSCYLSVQSSCCSLIVTYLILVRSVVDAHDRIVYTCSC